MFPFFFVAFLELVPGSIHLATAASLHPWEKRNKEDKDPPQVAIIYGLLELCNSYGELSDDPPPTNNLSGGTTRQ